MTQDIRSYVRRSLAQGFTPETIRAVLRKYSSWAEIEAEVEDELTKTEAEAKRLIIGGHLIKLVIAMAVLLLIVVVFTAIRNQSQRMIAPGTVPQSDLTAAVTCDEYCGKVQSACDGPRTQYPSERDCLTYCATQAKFPAGKREDPASNTIACRKYHANVASTTDPDIHCPHAGPSGGGVCGTYCNNYCHLSLKNCAGRPFTTASDCLARCAQYSPLGTPGNTLGDSVQCRIYHLGVAGVDVAAADIHCPHAAPDGGGVCVGVIPTRTDVASSPPPAPVINPPGPRCADYCTSVQTACVGDNQQYENAQTCLAQCASYRIGTPGETTGDTLSCRTYHAQVASAVDPAVHCTHAGPSGGGICIDEPQRVTQRQPISPSTEVSPTPLPIAQPTPAQQQAIPATQTITIQQFNFAPQEITIPIGTTVTWINNDNAPHTVTTADGRLNSPTLNQGDSFRHTFDTAGTFDYFSAIYPTITARLIVK
ncbi:cupredoxin family copper-binding protein [Candidatus Woesearchaeota archaeon]|nr:cupredoxin family copper-binding protein [Candidatus Woesearchaeota archaeon]